MDFLSSVVMLMNLFGQLTATLQSVKVGDSLKGYRQAFGYPFKHTKWHSDH
jgi:hypothetical protein